MLKKSLCSPGLGFSRAFLSSTNRAKFQHHPNLAEFMARSAKTGGVVTNDSNIISDPSGLKFYIETYGCQMNSSDSEIVRSILMSAGHTACNSETEADVILTNTCAIRENAEEKVWHRLTYFQSIRRKNKSKQVKSFYPVVGVLGCMAERLKDKLLLEDSVDFVCGPDAYRDIPRLLESLLSVGQKEANTVLSLDETYADISPVREVNSCSAFVSIMRGCNNMCSFCIVPFTRGRERSRPMASILKEVRALSDNGVKEVVLLGQNVNGYHDSSPESGELFPTSVYKATPGFSNLYQSRKRDVPGARFSDLLQAIALLNPEMRVRFTSPHPKDFPEEVLNVVRDHANICASLHLPIQSGSSSVLRRMRRGYSREAFLDLVQRVRDQVPGVSISTDVITGFCDETEEEHRDTLSAMRAVRFDQAFMFAYSLREKTHAAHTMQDNVPEETKQRRLKEIIDTYREQLLPKNHAEEHGQLRLVLVEGPSTRSTAEKPMLTGRTDGNKRVVFPATALFSLPAQLSEDFLAAPQISVDPGNGTPMCGVTSLQQLLFDAAAVDALSDADISSLVTAGYKLGVTDGSPLQLVVPEELTGRYAVVRVLKARTSTLRGVGLAVTTLQDFQLIHQRAVAGKR